MLRFMVLCCLTVVLSSCVYVDVTSPLDTNVNNTMLGTKQGRAKTHSVLWLVAWGNGGTAAAAADGGIERVTHLDVHYYSILFGLYASRTTIAYGD